MRAPYVCVCDDDDEGGQGPVSLLLLLLLQSLQPNANLITCRLRACVTEAAREGDGTAGSTPSAIG